MPSLWVPSLAVLAQKAKARKQLLGIRVTGTCEWFPSRGGIGHTASLRLGAVLALFERDNNRPIAADAQHGASPVYRRRKARQPHYRAAVGGESQQLGVVHRRIVISYAGPAKCCAKKGEEDVLAKRTGGGASPLVAGLTSD